MSNNILINKKQIAQLTPKDKSFQIIFQIAQIISQNQQQLICRIVDQTGIVNAKFNKFIDRIKLQSTYKMKPLKVVISNQHIQVQMTPQTVIEKMPNIIQFKDKANDISKKIFVVKQDLQYLNSDKKNIKIIADKNENQNDQKNNQNKQKQKQNRSSTIKETKNQQSSTNNNLQDIWIKNKKQQETKHDRQKKRVSFNDDPIVHGNKKDYEKKRNRQKYNNDYIKDRDYYQNNQDNHEKTKYKPKYQQKGKYNNSSHNNNNKNYSDNYQKHQNNKKYDLNNVDLRSLKVQQAEQILMDRGYYYSQLKYMNRQRLIQQIKKLRKQQRQDRQAQMDSNRNNNHQQYTNNTNQKNNHKKYQNNNQDKQQISYKNKNKNQNSTQLSNSQKNQKYPYYYQPSNKNYNHYYQQNSNQRDHYQQKKYYNHYKNNQKKQKTKQQPNSQNKNLNQNQQKKSSSNNNNNEGYISIKSSVQMIDHYVNTCVWVTNKKQTDLKNQNWRVIIADQSGSIWAQFNQSTVLQENQWYQLDNMKIQNQKNQILIKQTEMSQFRTSIKSKNRTYNLNPVN